MNFLVFLADGLVGIVGAGATNLVGLITGVLPNVLILLTMVNSIIQLIGTEKVDAFAKKVTRFRITRYTIIPFISLFFFTNPMCYTMARFVEEKYKGAVIDATFTMAHPITGIFPHANPGELFVWMGIATGLETLGMSTTRLAVWYLITGFIICFVRGIGNEIIYAAMDR
jgi:PTS system glucitol/sorbitol-specific IIC component